MAFAADGRPRWGRGGRWSLYSAGRNDLRLLYGEAKASMAPVCMWGRKNCFHKRNPAATLSGSTYNLQEVHELQEAFEVLPISGCLMDNAEIRNALPEKGFSSASFDILIGTTARANGCTVVTHNTKLFVRMPGVSLCRLV